MLYYWLHGTPAWASWVEVSRKWKWGDFFTHTADMPIIPSSWTLLAYILGHLQLRSCCFKVLANRSLPVMCSFPTIYLKLSSAFCSQKLTFLSRKSSLKNLIITENFPFPLFIYQIHSLQIQPIKNLFWQGLFLLNYYFILPRGGINILHRSLFLCS